MSPTCLCELKNKKAFCDSKRHSFWFEASTSGITVGNPLKKSLLNYCTVYPGPPGVTRMGSKLCIFIAIKQLNLVFLRFIVKFITVKKIVYISRLKKYYSFFFIILLLNGSIQKVHAQLEARYWYFGNSNYGPGNGLRFDSSKTVQLADGKMKSSMGCSTISDKIGNLLFYTHGETIWNSQHDTMKNGGKIKGQVASMQGAVIIPFPGNPYLYYVFTLSRTMIVPPGYDSGLYYHIVDMRGDNGKGEVVLKDQIVYHRRVAMRMAATFHADKKSVWIVIHEWNSNKFRSYLLTSNGLDTNVVVSSIGTVNKGNPDNEWGQMKFTTSGYKLAHAIAAEKIVEIFDFDNKTGKVSNCIKLNSSIFTNSLRVWGLEFSPNEKFLYATCQMGGAIYQIDISSGIDSIIFKSIVLLASSVYYPHFLSLQIGLDKKIYLSRCYWIACINNPDEKGTACNYKDTVFTFPFSTEIQCFPTFLQSYFYLPDIEIKNTCLGDTTRFCLNDTFNIDSVYWKFSDNSSSRSYYPCKLYADTGNYKVNVIIYYNNTSDSFERTFRISNYPNASFKIIDTSQCPDSNLFHFSNTSSAVDGAMTYEWDFGDSTKSFQQNPVKSYLLSDTFDVKLTVTSGYGCESSFDDPLIVYPKPKANFSINDSVQCFNENSFIFYDSSKLSYGKLSYQWDLGDSHNLNTSQKQVNYSYKNPVSHTYKVRLITVSDHGCSDTSVKQVVIYPSPKSDFSINDSAQCLNKQNFVINDLSTVTADSITKSVWYWDSSTLVNQHIITINNLKSGIIHLNLITSTTHNCPDTIVKQLIVHPLPKTDFIVNDSVQCFNEQNFEITNKSTIDRRQLKSTWYIENDSFITTKLKLSNLLPGSVDLKLVTVSGFNCINSISKLLTIFPSPSASFKINDTFQCLNSNSFEFTNTSVIQSGTMTHEWLIDSKIFKIFNLTDFKFSKWNKYPIRLISASNEGCPDTSISNVYVLPNPISAFIYMNNCLEDTMWFFDKSFSDSGSIEKWYWDFKNGNTSLIKDPYMLFNDTGQKSVELTSTNNFGCSNAITRFFKIDAHVTSPDIERVTVENNKNVLVEWNKPKEGIPLTYHLEKSYDSNNWVPISDFDNKTYKYTDQQTKIKHIYYYRMSVTDSCQYTSPYSNISKTILLTIDTNGQFPVLSWSPYEYWSSGIDRYELQRAGYSTLADLKTKSFVPIDSYFQPEIVSDTMSDLNYANYCYRIVAFRQSDQLESVSNEICIPAISHLFIPNVFTPNNDGLNDVFKPYGMYIIDYKIQIFNKWGVMLFESDEINNGWDGKFRGKDCSVDTYIYHISAKATNGSLLNKKGVVSLIR